MSLKAFEAIRGITEGFQDVAWQFRKFQRAQRFSSEIVLVDSRGFKEI